MPENRPLNILCVAPMLVGRPMQQEAARLGHKVWVLTDAHSIEDKDPWPRDILQDVIAVPKMASPANFEMVRNVVSYLHRTTKFDRIMPMTDWAVEIAAKLREHLRIPGMGETTNRYFRDKLAMRMKAHEDGVLAPEFTSLLSWQEINEYIERVPPPWLIKPRLMAASMGIKKINNRDELWPELDKLGDAMALNLMEKYTPGDVFHVDSVVSEREVVFASCSLYGRPILDLSSTGGVYTTHQIERGSPDEVALQAINRQVIKSLGLLRGVTHIEYIKGKDDGKFYFLEAAARVGSGRISEVIWFATDICLWWEWIRLECLNDHSQYRLPPVRDGYGGTIITLARTKEPDLSAYTDLEICFRQARKHHAGLIVKADTPARVEALLASYAERFAEDFMAHAPAEE